MKHCHSGKVLCCCSAVTAERCSAVVALTLSVGEGRKGPACGDAAAAWPHGSCTMAAACCRRRQRLPGGETMWPSGRQQPMPRSLLWPPVPPLSTAAPSCRLLIGSSLIGLPSVQQALQWR